VSTIKDVTELRDSGGTAEQFGKLVEAAQPLTVETLASLEKDWCAGGAQEPNPASVATVAADAEDAGGGQVDRLIRIAEGIELFHDSEGRGYASVQQGAHSQTLKLLSKEFKYWLVREYYRANNKRPPGDKPLNDALRALEARAQIEGPEHEVHLRVAEEHSRIYLDLANADWSAVEIDANGWRVVQRPPVYFRRPKGMRPLPEPVHGGTLADLRQFLNAPDDTTLITLVAWLVGTLSRGPYPILCLQGEQGSAKTTTARVLRALIDPAVAPLRTVPSDERDLMIAANSSRVLAFDNLSGTSTRTSDALCRLATGGGFATRELYSNDDEAVIEATRPIILNGIDEIASRQDLVDRSLIVTLPAISDKLRRTESDLWEQFRIAQPALLGALCDAGSAALRNLGTVSTPILHRMADFTKWVIAAETALPWKQGEFMAIYTTERQHAIEVANESDPVATGVVELCTTKPWRGTASQLLEALNRNVSEAVRKSPRWPKHPSAMGNRLRRAATFLRMRGIDVATSREAGTGRRIIEITKTTPSADAAVTGVTPPVSSPPANPLVPSMRVTDIDLLPVEPASSVEPNSSLNVAKSDGCDNSTPTQSGNLDLDWPELGPEI
jgi:hypothetical protein